MLKYSEYNKEEVYKAAQSCQSGLTQKQAEARLAKNGFNKLEEKKKKSVLGLFFSQFGDLMTALLIGAALISAAVAVLQNSLSDLFDTAIICAIILLNAVVGTFQQYRADKAIEGLKKLNGSLARVRRGGVVSQIDATHLVVGDVVLLEEGDVVPADIRLTGAAGLRCVEASLTGESASVEKISAAIKGGGASYASAKNFAFSSTFVVGGNGEGVVVATGNDTQIGGVASMLGGLKKSLSPLEKSLNKLGKVISIFVVLVAAIVFCVGVFCLGGGVLENFMTAVAIAVAAVPEGLPAVVSVITAMGVQRLSKQSAVIRKMKCVETLGSCTKICTDKTGTLTNNQMRVISVISAQKGGSLAHSMGLNLLYECMAACNNVKGERGAYMGDPTEIALRICADEHNFNEKYERLGEIPFSSERRLMSVKVSRGGNALTFCKGAPEKVLSLCTRICDSGGERALTESDRQYFLNECQKMQAQALRVLAFAYRGDGVLEESGLTLLGACGMEDGLKEGVVQAVEECKRAGVSTVMITGDSPQTAFAIAKKAGICCRPDRVYTGEQLDKMTKPQLKKAAQSGQVFARVSPKHKNIIVKLLQSCGEVVVMTGDGVNDAPCVKSADVGIVMGSGTEVAKSVADVVVCDDNFTTIVGCVREGRRISSNVRKTIEFFLSTNLAEVLSILIVTFAFMGCGFLPSTQLLWLNLITDGFPVLGLGVEKGLQDEMNHPPIRTEKSLFSRRTLSSICFSALYITAITVGVYCFAFKSYGVAVAQTAAFITISFAELFQVMNVRAGNSSAFCGMFSNKLLLGTVVAGVCANLLLCLTPLGAAFKIVPMPTSVWLASVGCSLSVIAFGEFYKLLSRILSGRGARGNRQKLYPLAGKVK